MIPAKICLFVLGLILGILVVLIPVIFDFNVEAQAWDVC